MKSINAKKLNLLVLSFILVISIGLVIASNDNFNINKNSEKNKENNFKNYGQCVSNSTKIENICFKETKIVFNTCRLKALEDIKNNSINKSKYKIIIKECQNSFKNNTDTCKDNFKISKENCLIFKCDYNSTDKNYLIKSPSGCKKMDKNSLSCDNNHKFFKDSCGCGCVLEKSKKNETKNESDNKNEKNYCSSKLKSSNICPYAYQPVCGWFNSSIQCFKYPCAQEFSNSCFACNSPNVEYWTNGKCPNK
jgi:hypothetical protein